MHMSGHCRFKESTVVSRNKVSVMFNFKCLKVSLFFHGVVIPRYTF